MLTPLLLVGWLLQAGQIEIPQPVGFVNDFAHVIPADVSARMAAVIQDVRAKSRGEIVVVTLPDLRGRDPSDVAREIGRRWKVGASGGPGDRARNGGVIILLVPKETSSDGHGYSRIEVGQGAEGFLTDGIVGAIQDQAIPLMVEREYAAALELEVELVAGRFASEFGFTREAGAPAPQTPRPARRSSGPRIPPFVWVLLILLILRIARRRRYGGGGALPWIVYGMLRDGGRRGGWSSGGFGGGGGGGGGGFGGFGGFGGGGGFSGGGAGRSF